MSREIRASREKVHSARDGFRAALTLKRDFRRGSVPAEHFTVDLNSSLLEKAVSEC